MKGTEPFLRGGRREWLPYFKRREESKKKPEEEWRTVKAEGPIN